VSSEVEEEKMAVKLKDEILDDHNDDGSTGGDS